MGDGCIEKANFFGVMHLRQVHPEMVLLDHHGGHHLTEGPRRDLPRSPYAVPASTLIQDYPCADFSVPWPGVPAGLPWRAGRRRPGPQHCKPWQPGLTTAYRLWTGGADTQKHTVRMSSRKTLSTTLHAVGNCSFSQCAQGRTTALICALTGQFLR